MWINLSRLLTNLRNRRIHPRDVMVFVDDHLVKPRYEHPHSQEPTFEEDEDLYENDSEED